jgi:putative phosphoesterase
MIVGLLADTHVPHRMAALPPSLFERLDGVDLILHAGDLDDPAILDELGRIAPAQAVRGNFHIQSPWPNDRRLPLFLDMVLAGQRVVVTHGHFSFWNSFWEKFGMWRSDHRLQVSARIMARVIRVVPHADVYVFGHTHLAMVRRQAGALFVNPGAVCPTRYTTPSVARLTLTPDRAKVEILPL